MTTETLLLILIAVLLIGALPTWPYSRSWGYNPSGVLLVVLVGLIVWSVMERRNTDSVGTEINQGLREAGEDVKELGRDVAETVRDVAN